MANQENLEFGKAASIVFDSAYRKAQEIGESHVPFYLLFWSLGHHHPEMMRQVGIDPERLSAETLLFHFEPPEVGIGPLPLSPFAKNTLIRASNVARRRQSQIIRPADLLKVVLDSEANGTGIVHNMGLDREAVARRFRIDSNEPKSIDEEEFRRLVTDLP